MVFSEKSVGLVKEVIIKVYDTSQFETDDLFMG